MSVIELLTRVEAICNKYDRYDIEKQKDTNVSSGDAFARLYSALEADIEAALEKAELASKEKSRTSAVAFNADIRHTKARLLEEVPKLQRLAMKKSWKLREEERLIEIVDPELTVFLKDEVLRFIKVALFGTQEALQHRSAMKQVVEMLSKEVQLNEKMLFVLMESKMLSKKLFPVPSTFGAPTYFSLQLAAASYFGIKAYGVQLNAYVEKDGNEFLWIAKRSQQKQTHPGMLDTIVAGGEWRYTNK